MSDQDATELFPFRYFDAIRGRWVDARYKASRENIAKRYEKWEITGPAERRASSTGQFKPPTQ